MQELMHQTCRSRGRRAELELLSHTKDSGWRRSGAAHTKQTMWLQISSKPPTTSSVRDPGLQWLGSQDSRIPGGKWNKSASQPGSQPVGRAGETVQLGSSPPTPVESTHTQDQRMPGPGHRERARTHKWNYSVRPANGCMTDRRRGAAPAANFKK